MASAINITPKQWEMLKNAQRRLTDLIGDCDKCEQVGIKMDEARSAIAELLGQTQAIEQTFSYQSLARTKQPPS